MSVSPLSSQKRRVIFLPFANYYLHFCRNKFFPPKFSRMSSTHSSSLAVIFEDKAPAACPVAWILVSASSENYFLRVSGTPRGLASVFRATP